MSESFFRDYPEDHETTSPVSEAFEGKQPDTGSADTPPEEMSDDDRIAAMMSYIPLLCFIPLMNMNWKDNKQARFHARQGVVLFLIELVALLFLIDDLAKFVFRAVLVLSTALSAAGIYFALQGKSFRLPIISDIADKAKL